MNGSERMERQHAVTVQKLLTDSKLVEDAKAVICEGLKEHWGESFDINFNEDLVNFESHYLVSVVETTANAPAMFVAVKDGQVVGTGALIPEDVQKEIQSCKTDDFAKVEERKVMRIVRMSVAKECRRCGVGSVVLRELLRVAKQERGCTELVVETTADWDDAVAFYLHNGFIPQGVRDGDMHFAYKL